MDLRLAGEEQLFGPEDEAVVLRSGMCSYRKYKLKWKSEKVEIEKKEQLHK